MQPPRTRNHTTWRLLLREVQMIAKDHSLLLTLLIAPLLYAFFYGSIYMNKAEEKVPLDIVDNDRTGLSRTYIQQINNMQMVQVNQFTNLETAMENMRTGKTQGFLMIEKNMERKVMSLQQSTVTLVVNAAKFLPSSDLMQAITTATLTVGAGVRLQYNLKQGYNNDIALQETQPANVDFHPLFNSGVNYGTFLLPGLLALILQQTLLIGLAGGTAAERQKHTFYDWLQVANGNYSLALWGKGLFYFVLFAVYGYFFMNVNYSVLNLDRMGSSFQLSILIALFILTLIPMAMWIGMLFKSQLLCTQMMAFSTYPIFLITGYTWPISELPKGLQLITALLPTTPFINVYTAIVQQNASMIERMPAVVHLCVLWLFYTVLCIWKMHRLAKAGSSSLIVLHEK
ncbi:ABC-2 type transport system permease protein [Chitinophaga skermanii]|uniref:ABC-2 type transport system permease protein n=1 Tax=Chitinophaga skermanii TaxID=331697 RepID=A0A327QXQ2_9BACT|nr:ABC transporter permease [Chitinophaga skermanii]RAJ08422.1 ABC-2 type transport system permease protein [Chitinophaga skermanii]